MKKLFAITKSLVFQFFRNNRSVQVSIVCTNPDAALKATEEWQETLFYKVNEAVGKISLDDLMKEKKIVLFGIPNFRFFEVTLLEVKPSN